ncbi:MAG: signal peptidase I [Arachnia sp.]
MRPQVSAHRAVEAPQGSAPIGLEWDLVHTDQQSPTKRRGVRRVLGWPLLIVMIVALWPATWGGLTGVAVVTGNSMERVYDPNDVLLTLRQSAYAVGDVISYKVPMDQDGAGRSVTHRIVAVDDSGEGPMFITQGDSNPSVDPWMVKAADITGKAVLRIPRIGSAFSGSAGLLLGAVAGLAVLVVLGTSRFGAGKRTPEITGHPSTNGHPLRS